MYIDKQYARRSLLGYESSFIDPFQYRSITEIHEQALLDIIRDITRGSLGRDLAEDPKALLDGMIEFAGNVYDPSHWLVAYEGDTPAGVVFAQRYHDLLHAGSLFLVGLTAAYRGKGLGKVIHAKGLELLSKIGCELYIGSTDTNNTPMLRVFEANGCGLSRVIRVRVEPGVGIIEEE